MGMTEQEAIEELKNYRACSGTELPEEMEVAIKALEKQIPKKLKTADIGYTMYGCPNCDYTDSLWSLKKRDKHCPNCGQALDWGGE